MAKTKSYLTNTEALIQAGIDPKTGLPIKAVGSLSCELPDNIRKVLRVMDEQTALNRYKWYNLPAGLDANLLERILYYRGQACLFYMKENNTFYFLPYTLDAPKSTTGIDIYGRFRGITPTMFNGSYNKEKNKFDDTPFIQGVIKYPQYEVVLPEDLTEEILADSCVILHDYSKQQSETNISRQILNDPLLSIMSEAFPLARTSLIANSGVKGMRVSDDDQQAQVKAASRALTKSALNGDPWIPFVGNVDFQDLTNAGALKCEEFLLYMQSLDNFRLSTYGLQSGGIFQKKEQLLQSEQEMNENKYEVAFTDGLELRQRFCDIVNSIWGLGIWCDEGNEQKPDEAMFESEGDSTNPQQQGNGGSNSDE